MVFSGKTFIVTGGTRGIGAACVTQLVRNGARVVFTGRSAERDGSSERANAVFVQGDASVEADCLRAIEAALDLGKGQIDGLVNNAGIGRRQSFAGATAADFDQIMSVNVRSAFLFTRHALEGLVRARGSVVMISSIAGAVGEEGLGIYTASKAALIGLTRALALEIGADVRVNAICPGQIETEMMASTLKIPGRRESLTSRIPSARLGTSEDIAEAVTWLLSSASAFVNGAVITVDGGETAGLRNPVCVATPSKVRD